MRVGNNAVALYIQSHFQSFVISLVLFAIGVFAGSLYCVILPAGETESLRAAFTGSDGLFAVSDSWHVFRATFVNYLQLWILLSLCGTCSIGTLLSPVFIGLRGFVCGFCVSLFLLLFSVRGALAATVGLLPQMLIALPAMQMLSAGAAAHVHRTADMTDRTLRRAQFFSYCVYCLLLLAVFAVAALYEGYVGWRWICHLLS